MSQKTARVIITILSVLIILLLIIVIIAARQTRMTPPPEPTPEIIESTPEPTPEIIEVRSIRIILASDEVVKGAKFQPEIIIQPENATDKFYEIHSDDESVLQVQGRLMIAIDVGTAKLTATASNGVIGTVTVTVLPPALESLSFIDDEITLSIGDTLTLVPNITPSDAQLEEEIEYSSDNENVATVTELGMVTAVGAGSATITAKAGEVNAEFRVTVIVPVRYINIIMNRRVYSVGNQAEFTIQVDPPNATNAEVRVEYSGASVTPTGDTTFICNAPGEVSLTFTAENSTSTSITITVHDLQALADEVHRLTNIERANLGLSQLGRNQALTQTALVRANEIVTFFSHTRPNGSECFTAFEENNVQYRHAGENLAAGQRSPAEAVQSWMDSPGHRENIVNINFGQMGVGVVMDNDGRLYWTQTFTD